MTRKQEVDARLLDLETRFEWLVSILQAEPYLRVDYLKALDCRIVDSAVTSTGKRVACFGDTEQAQAQAVGGGGKGEGE